jgi:hypothetical protein
MAKQVVEQAGISGAMMPMVLMGEDPVLSLGRHEMIAREAYLRAEQRGFQGGDPMTDWLEAEAEVDRLLNLNL